MRGERTIPRQFREYHRGISSRQGLLRGMSLINFIYLSFQSFFIESEFLSEGSLRIVVKLVYISYQT